ADLRRKSLEYEVKGTLLNYLVASSQEQEVLDAQSEVKKAHENLNNAETKYSEAKENAAAQSEKMNKLLEEKKEAESAAESLGEEKTRLENDIYDLQLSAALQYDEGFSFALEQVKILFPDLDAECLGEADAMKKIVDGKLVPYVLPEQ
ncbi:hypothetical protein A2U01_0019403, partial [Trifolium medium]|nr:hypothetical protein [Trifolium medium]